MPLQIEMIEATSLILERDALVARVNAERVRGLSVVLANGCFDVLHAGHIRYLQGARALGDILVVGINSDSRVAKPKGRRTPDTLRE